MTRKKKHNKSKEVVERANSAHTVPSERELQLQQLANISRKARFSKARFEELKNDLSRLETFRQDFEEFMDTLPLNDEKLEFARLLGVVKYQISNLRRRMTDIPAKPKESTPRVAAIDFQIAESEMQFMYDYSKFEEKVEILFEWHKKGKMNFLAPYFTFIQSSGMGKTKLLYEFKKRHTKRKVFLILCIDSTANDKPIPKIFDFPLLAVLTGLDRTKERQRIVQHVMDIVKEAGDMEEVLLLFDESQVLLKHLQGFALRVLRSWLRTNLQCRRVCAVFVGSSPELFYFDRDDCCVQAPRDPYDPYNQGTKLYDPFYHLFTIGLKQLQRNGKPTTESSSANLHRAAGYGRPLFALLAAKGVLDDGVLTATLRRMLIDEKIDCTEQLSDIGCLSVLGTRVQMGQTSIGVATQLIDRGYATLTHLSSTDDVLFAHICFLPDPVCAFLAMNLMVVNPNFPESRNPRFWTQKAIHMYSTSLCRLENGCVGHVGAALYLLFCGDVLRYAVDPSLRTFSVSLCALLELAIEPKEVYKINAADLSSTTSLRISVSFIQVCRNYLQQSVKELTKSACLEEWFTAGCAFYAFPNCGVYDIIAPVFIESNQDVRFCPMLISVKSGITYTESQATSDVEAMRNDLQETEDHVGICVLLLIGLSSTNSVLFADTAEKVRCRLQNWKGDSIISFIIVVPDGDCFGCWDLVTKAAIGGGKASEMYSSHFQVYQCGEASGKLSDVRLRRNVKEDANEDLRKLIIRLRSRVNDDVKEDLEKLIKECEPIRIV